MTDDVINNQFQFGMTAYYWCFVNKYMDVNSFKVHINLYWAKR